MWCRRWQGAVGVVDWQCRRTEVAQFLHVYLVNPSLMFKNVVSASKTMVGWGLAEIGTRQEGRVGRIPRLVRIKLSGPVLPAHFSNLKHFFRNRVSFLMRVTKTSQLSRKILNLRT